MRCPFLLAATLVAGVASATSAQPGQPPTAKCETGTCAPVTGLESASPCAGPDCAPQMFWFETEYLMWFLRRESVPPLIRVVNAMASFMDPLPPGSSAPVFPEDGRRLDFDGFSGVRLSAGAWLNARRTIGVDATAFVLEQRTEAFQIGSAGVPVIARFYINANSGRDTSLFFAQPNMFSGALAARAEVNEIYSIDGNLRWSGYTVFADRTDYLTGFRYFDLREQLDINGRVTFPSTTRLFVNDQFATSNQFYGAQIGLRAMYCAGSRFEATGIFKLGIGAVEQQVRITGNNRFETPDGLVDRQAGGLYARPSNIGSYSRDRFAVLPELTLNARYRATDSIKLFVGYNILYLSSVVRPGQAIDPVVNDQNIRYIANPTPGPSPRPTFFFRGVDLWLQGVNFGVALEF